MFGVPDDDLLKRSVNDGCVGWQPGVAHADLHDATEHGEHRRFSVDGLGQFRQGVRPIGQRELLQRRHGAVRRQREPAAATAVAAAHGDAQLQEHREPSERHLPDNEQHAEPGPVQEVRVL